MKVTRSTQVLGLTAAILTSLALVLTMAPAAHADPSPTPLTVTEVQPGVNPSSKTVTGLTYLFDHAPAAGTVIHVAAFSCGNFLQESSYTSTGGSASYDLRTWVYFSPDGQPSLIENAVSRKVGKSVQWQMDIVQPGYDAYHLSGSVTDYGTVDGKPVSSYRPSCEEINGGTGTGGAKCVVKVKSKKIGKARVGRTVKVRKVATNGHCGRVTYTWQVSGKTVKKGKSMQVRQSMRGKKVTVKVNLSKGPDRVLRFGRAK